MSDRKALPPLYGSVRLLDRSRDADLRIRPLANHKFAARQNVFPLTVPEFVEASRSAPVVFLRAGDAVRAVMVAASAPGANLLIGPDGRWRAGAYVPAYVRRHPFVLVATADGKKLGIDPDAPQLSSVEGEALVENGAPSAALERARTFCAAFDAAWTATESFCAALAAAEVLVPAVTTLTAPGAEPRRVDGFEMVDPGRLAALDPAKLAEWERDGTLMAVHAHRASLNRWKDVAAPAAAA